VGLAPDIAVAPGVATYQVPLTGLTPAQAIYLRTVGFNARDHAALGNVTWTLREVRAGGIPLSVRDLITHDNGTAEGGLQGAIVNFDNAAVLGNNGGQNQTGLSQNPSGSGSLRWTDVGTNTNAAANGAAISWGNGTAWNNNTFNNRTTDLSGYKKMIVTMSARDVAGGGGNLGFNAFFQADNFAFQGVEGGAAKSIPIDNTFHDVVFDLTGMNNVRVVDQIGINLFSHAADLTINVDRIRFSVPEPASLALVGAALVGGVAATWRRRS
jgi:hypothetical protein